MMDSISEQRLCLVHPLLAQKIRTVADQLLHSGIVIRVIQGFRSFQMQDDLFAQGRTTPGRIVTEARGGDSYHNYGLAVDCCPGVTGWPYWTPDWVSVDKHTHKITPSWQKMIDAGKAQGLVSGSQFIDFPDFPHFQMTGILPLAKPTTEAKALLLSHGVQAVWKLAQL